MRNLFVLPLVALFLASPVVAKEPIKLSLDDAILLAVRTNPNVEIAKLNHEMERLHLGVAEWQFSPHYGLEASLAAGRSIVGGKLAGSQNNNVQPSVSLLTPIGTQMTLSAANTETNHYNPGLSFQLMQPLMRGFGKAVVESALDNAKDTEIIARLNIEESLRTTISAIINAYLDRVAAEQALAIDQQALLRMENSVKQTKLLIQAGRMAGNELISAEATVASAKTQLTNDKNNLIQTRYTLLSAIGLDPNAPIDFANPNLAALINKYHLPSLAETKQKVLANDIQYQIDQITLHGSTSRNVLVAKDNTRWQLNFSGTASTGNGSGGGESSGINSLFNGFNQGQSVGLTLQVPIDDRQSAEALANAKIALREAELALMQEKWSKETNAVNGWNLVVSSKAMLKFAQDAETLQEKTYHLNDQKYLHGLIDSLELQTAQSQLIEAQQTLLSAQINYIKALANIDILTGNTLKTWNIQVRT